MESVTPKEQRPLSGGKGRSRGHGCPRHGDANFKGGKGPGKKGTFKPKGSAGFRAFQHVKSARPNDEGLWEGGGEKT